MHTLCAYNHVGPRPKKKGSLREKQKASVFSSMVSSKSRSCPLIDNLIADVFFHFFHTRAGRVIIPCTKGFRLPPYLDMKYFVAGPCLDVYCETRRS